MAKKKNDPYDGLKPGESKQTKHGTLSRHADGNGMHFAPAKTKAPKQLEIPGAGVKRIGDLDDACNHQLGAKDAEARAKKERKTAEGRIQLLLTKHKIASYVFVDGAVKRRFFREAKEGIKSEVVKDIATKATRTRRVGADRPAPKKKARPDVMPAPQVSP